MQETKFLYEEGNLRHREEMFSGDDYVNLTAQMNERLIELGTKHTLVRRKYYQRVSSMREVERMKKRLKKKERQLKRDLKETKLTALKQNNLQNNPIDSKYELEK